MRKLQYCHWLCADSSDFFQTNTSSQPSMLGIKSQPLDDDEVLLFMAFCSYQKLLFPMNYSCTKTWFSLFGVVEILSFMMIPPLSSFQYPSSIQSLILALFDSVLGPKKSFKSVSRTWAKTLLAARNPFSTLDI